MKHYTCVAGSFDNRIVQNVCLHDLAFDVQLTPAIARRAARLAFGHITGVTVWSDEYGYHLRGKAAKKLIREEE